MGHPLEYVVNNALMECSEGTVPVFFRVTPRRIRVQNLEVANASDKVPITNIPSFVICKKLGGPCVPVPMEWQDTYPVQINKQELLIFRSCIRCSAGQGKIEFLTSGQTPLTPEMMNQLYQMQQQSIELLEQAEAAQNAVGETGFWEGMIPVWGSGRDMINAIQTGDVGGAFLNGGFLVWDVASIVVAIPTLGTGTAAMQAAKGGLKGLLKTGLKKGGKELLQQGLQQLEKAVLRNKQALMAGLTALAKTRVCVLACFPAGTPVAVEDGQKNIEDIEVGDRVWSRHEETGELALKRVVTTQQRETDHLLHLGLGEERLSTTVEHPFWLAGRGWVKAGELRLGDRVLRSDGTAEPVTAIEHQTEFDGDQPPIVYNIEVGEWPSYLVGRWRWWVHNAKICIGTTLRTIGGKAIINSKYRGGVNPKALAKGFDVPVKLNGYPDFAKYVYKGAGKSSVTIEMTGKYADDFAAANKKAGHASTPKGYTWHHTEVVNRRSGKIYNRMELVETPAHEAARHSGGAQIYRETTGKPGAYN